VLSESYIELAVGCGEEMRTSPWILTEQVYLSLPEGYSSIESPHVTSEQAPYALFSSNTN
jgi:hypothetical protein